MKRQTGHALAIRAFAYCALLGGAVFLFGLVGGLLRTLPVGAALGMGYAGLLLMVVSLRELRREVRLLSKARRDSVNVTTGRTATPGMALRWKVAAVGNTLAGLVLSALALAFLPISWGIVVTVVMAAGILVTWRFERHISGQGARASKS